MILVVTEQMNLRFVLQHQGKFLQSARTGTEALRILRDNLNNIQGVVLDDRISNSRLVSSYVRTNAPGVKLVSWQLAQQHSPFRIEGEQVNPKGTERNESRFVLKPVAAN
jgi:hypothetical protein